MVSRVLLSFCLFQNWFDIQMHSTFPIINHLPCYSNCLQETCHLVGNSPNQSICFLLSDNEDKKDIFRTQIISDRNNGKTSFLLMKNFKTHRVDEFAKISSCLMWKNKGNFLRKIKSNCCMFLCVVCVFKSAYIS